MSEIDNINDCTKEYMISSGMDESGKKFTESMSSYQKAVAATIENPTMAIALVEDIGKSDIEFNGKTIKLNDEQLKSLEVAVLKSGNFKSEDGAALTDKQIENLLTDEHRAEIVEYHKGDVERVNNDLVKPLAKELGLAGDKGNIVEVIAAIADEAKSSIEECSAAKHVGVDEELKSQDLPALDHGLEKSSGLR